MLRFIREWKHSTLRNDNPSLLVTFFWIRQTPVETPASATCGGKGWHRTYVGCSKAGIPGGIIATFAVVLPAFLIILVVTVMLRKALGNKYVQAVLMGLKPCIIGIISATGCYMILNNCVVSLKQNADFWPICMTAILAIFYYGSRLLRKKKMSLIILIMISAVLGVAVYGIQ